MAKSSELTIKGQTVTLTNTDKVLFPDDGITKGDLIDYYHRIAENMLPYVKGRPLMMHRFIHGIKGEGFYQKEAGDYFPKWVHQTSVKKVEGGITNFVVVENPATLVYLAEQDCITPHVWLSRSDLLEKPTR